MNDFSRRNRIDLLTSAEKAIYDAMQKVEELPADERLTEAVILLQDAKNKVSDYVDSKPKRITDNVSCSHNNVTKSIEADKNGVRVTTITSGKEYTTYIR